MKIENGRKRMLIVAGVVGSLAASQAMAVMGTSSSGPIQRMEIPGELIVAVKPAAMKSGAFTFPGSESIFEVSGPAPAAILKVSTGDTHSKTNALMKEVIEAMDEVLWVQPNYRYIGDPRESLGAIEGLAADPLESQQYHHAVMKNQEAWAHLDGVMRTRPAHLRSTTVVAVADDGFERDHEDLAAMYSINAGEIPGNKIDDDGNGYVDDVSGWDFSANDADPSAGMYDNHGTHCAGIVAAERGNGKGGSGTAPYARVMPLRFYGASSWTSEVVARTYAYAADNGARILTTSYNIDGFADDQLFEAALQYVYDRGVLAFNSAGNGNALNPRRQKFETALFVCSTVADERDNDTRSSFSNYGTGIDVCAPGGGGAAGIMSTIDRNGYQRMSGTSMASPNAAAVAALIWTKFPHWTRDQVAAQLLGTADSIDAKNPSHKGLLGTGRVNSLRALTQAPPMPRIGAVVEVQQHQLFAGSTRLTVQMPVVLDPSTVMDGQNWLLVKVTGNRWNKVLLTPTKVYRVGTNEMTFDVPALEAGTYRLMASGKGIRDPFGRAMGADYVQQFVVKKN